MSIAAEEWKAEGIQIGQAMGKAEGKAEGKADMLLRQLRRRFDSLPEAVVAKVRNASEDQLNEWADNILDARNLDMVFSEAQAELTPAPASGDKSTQARMAASLGCMAPA